MKFEKKNRRKRKSKPLYKKMETGMELIEMMGWLIQQTKNKKRNKVFFNGNCTIYKLGCFCHNKCLNTIKETIVFFSWVTIWRGSLLFVLQFIHLHNSKEV